MIIEFKLKTDYLNSQWIKIKTSLAEFKIYLHWTNSFRERSGGHQPIFFYCWQVHILPMIMLYVNLGFIFTKEVNPSLAKPPYMAV